MSKSTAIDPAASTLFAPWTDPETGVESYLLDDPAIARSCGFRRVRRHVTADDRYCWLYTAGTDEPLALTVLDFHAGDLVRAAPIGPEDPAPCVDPSTGAVDFVVDTTVSNRGPRPDDDRRPIGRFDAADGEIVRVASDLTRSSDGDRIAAIVTNGAEWRLVSLYQPTGEVDVWHSRSSAYDLLRFSPTDPTVALLARDGGVATAREQSEAWLAREGLGARPLTNLLPTRHRAHWWAPGGDGIWYVAPNEGVGHLDLELGRRRTVWNVPADRAHATRDGSFLAATTRAEPGQLAVTDTSGSSIPVVSETHAPTEQWSRQPQFVADDTYLAHTVIVDGSPVFALTPVDALKRQL